MEFRKGFIYRKSNSTVNNKIVNKHLLLFALICYIISTPLNSFARNISDNKFELLPDSLYLHQQDDSIVNIAIEARFAVTKNKEREGESDSKCRILWNYKSHNDYLFAELTWRNTNFGDFTDCRQALVRIGKAINGVDSIIVDKVIEKGVNLSTGYNTLFIEGNDNNYKIYLGSERLQYIASMKSNDRLFATCGISSTVKTTVSKFFVETKPDVRISLRTNYSEQNIRERLATSLDENEAIWSYLDRNNDVNYAIIGGKYRIALIKDGNDYLIVYISGAQTNMKNWQEGMIKGRLKQTIFENHYDLIWYDSMFDVIDSDAHASIKNSILTLEFPIYKTSIRFYKEL